MKKSLLFLLLPASLAGQTLPTDYWNPGIRKTINPKYQQVRFADTVVLSDESFWGALFNRDVRLRLPFKSFALVEVLECVTQEKGPPMCSDHQVAVKDWRSKIMDGKPGCFGQQLNEPQGAFYFEDLSPEGVTIRGKAGMVIKFYCGTAAVKQ